jgi:hypothetical protein
MSAWLCVQVVAPVRGKIASAISHKRRPPAVLFASSRGAKTRFKTRATFVSTNAARRS